MCLAALLCDQLFPIHEWRCQDIDQVLPPKRCFLSSASSSTEVPGQNGSSSISSILPTTTRWFWKNVGKDSKLAIGDSRCPSFDEANQSTVKSKDSLYFHTSSSPVEANNSKSANHSIVKSKDSLYFHMSSLYVEASNSKSAHFVHGG